MIGLVEDAQAAIESTAHDLKTIRADLNGTHGPLMLGLHEELAEVKGPHSQVCVLATSDTERLIDRYTIDGGVVCLVGSLERLSMIVHLEDHAMLGAHEKPLEGLVLLGVYRTQAVLEIETGEDCVSCMVVQDDRRATDATVILNAPKSYIFLSARRHS